MTGGNLPVVRRLAPVTLLGRVGPRSVRERVLAKWMAASNDGWLDVRTSLLRWALNSDPLDVPDLLGPCRVDRPVTWSLWDTGVESAPALVQQCLRSQGEFGEQVVLTADTVADYVVLPEQVVARRNRMATVHFSDILRLLLLAAHGGTWMDATVLLTGPAPAEVESAPFFAFTRPSDPFLLSSWYLKAEQGNPLVVAWLELLLRYWRDHEEIADYFLVHFLFEVLVLTRPEMMERWGVSPERHFQLAVNLQDELASSFDQTVWDSISERSSIHKLTYKVDGWDFARDSYFARIESGLL